MHFDDKDRLILALLNKNSRRTASDMAHEVRLSVPAITDRITKLVDNGIIKAFSVSMDARKLGYDLTAFITVVSSSSDHYEDIVNQANLEPLILECHSITGEGSHLLKIQSRNSTDLEILLRKIQIWPGVTRTNTMLVLSTYKENTGLDLVKLEKNKSN